MLIFISVLIIYLIINLIKIFETNKIFVNPVNLFFKHDNLNQIKLIKLSDFSETTTEIIQISEPLEMEIKERLNKNNLKKNSKLLVDETLD